MARRQRGWGEQQRFWPADGYCPSPSQQNFPGSQFASRNEPYYYNQWGPENYPQRPRQYASNAVTPEKTNQWFDDFYANDQQPYVDLPPLAYRGNPESFSQPFSSINESPHSGPHPELHPLPHVCPNLDIFTMFASLLMPRQRHPRGKTYMAMYWLELHGGESGASVDGASFHSPIFVNDHGGTVGPIGNHHAEDHLLKHLLVQLSAVDKDRLSTVTIMQNSSPCYVCAKAYKEKLTEKLLLQNKVTLVFSSMHWVRRPSNQRHQHQIHYTKHETNMEYLLLLKKSSVKFRSAGYNDWMRLCEALQLRRPEFLKTVDNYNNSSRGEEDRKLSEDLEQMSLCDSGS